MNLMLLTAVLRNTDYQSIDEVFAAIADFTTEPQTVTDIANRIGLTQISTLVYLSAMIERGSINSIEAKWQAVGERE